MNGVSRYIRYTILYGNYFLSKHNAVFVRIWFRKADWNGCKLSRNSTFSFVDTVAVGAVSLKSKKQPPVAACTAEADCMAHRLSALNVFRLEECLHLHLPCKPRHKFLYK